MPKSRYVMRDLTRCKVDNIMDFDVAQRRNRSRSLLEITIFFVAVGAYLCALALSA